MRNRSGQQRTWPDEATRYVRDALRGRVALACSGGVDSTALAIVAASIVHSEDATPPIVVHVDHAAREGSEREADHVAELTRLLTLPFVRARVRWCGISAGTRREHELRDARYEALSSVVAMLGLDAVVTAHTRDDQVETVLMRLFSGAGGTAAAGMQRLARLSTSAGDVEVRRPLLTTRRAIIRGIVDAAPIPHLDDPSNEDRRFRRNAIRHDIVPRIDETYPGFDGALLRSVALAARDAAYIDEVAAELALTAVRREDNGSSVARGDIRFSHPAIASRLIRLAVADMIGEHGRELTVERLDAVINAASGRTGATIELPGRIIVTVERDRVVFRQEGIEIPSGR